MTARVATGRAVTPTLLRRAAPPVFDYLGFNPQHRALIHAAHRDVVHAPGGTAYWALETRGLNVDGVEMAGKTGTAQVYSITPEERAAGVREQEDLPWRLRNHGLFVAYAPAEAPRYAVAVVVEHGGGGSTAAARPARDILRDRILRNPSGARPVPAAAGAAAAGGR